MSSSLYSFIVQSVFCALEGRPVKKTGAFLTPMRFNPGKPSIDLSVPVAFQYPTPAALLGLSPFGYFLSLGLKKYHSSSPNKAFSAQNNQANLIEENNSVS